MKLHYKLIKQLLVTLIVLFCMSNVYSQDIVNVNIQQPPHNQLRIEHLWKITLNNTSQDVLDVYLYGTLSEQSKGLIASGTSSRMNLSPGVKSVNVKEIEPVSVEYHNPDPKYKEALIRAGNLPSGEYEICVYVRYAETNKNCGSDCIQHSIEIMPAPMLISPGDGETVVNKKPMFTWMQAVRPGIDVKYKLRIVEVRDKQSPETAMQKNPAWFEQDNIMTRVFQYPTSAQELMEESKYAWQVTSLDFFGNPIGENNGLSEVESFEFVFLTNDEEYWANNYKNCPPKDNEEVDKEPIFHWNPYPIGNAEYKLRIWEDQSYNGGIITTSDEPYFSIGNLTNNFYYYKSTDPSLMPGRKYIYNVSAMVGNQIITGVNIQMIIKAVSKSDSKELKDLHDRLRKLKVAIAALREELQKNPLIKITCIQTLLDLLQGEDLLDAVQKILDSELENPDNVIIGLDYLEKLLKFIANTDKDKADKYKKYAEIIKRLNNKLKEAKDDADKVKLIFDEIKTFLNDLKKAKENPFDFVEGKLKEKLKEILTNLLIKLLEKKVAGPLISILSDLVDLADLLLIINDIDGLEREYNKLRKEFIKKVLGENDFAFENLVWLKGDEWLSCDHIKITANKHCWKPKEGGEPNEGTWESHEMTFAGGFTSLKKKYNGYIEK